MQQFPHEMVRLSGSWMSIWDDRILEILQADGPKSPTKILETGIVHVSRAQISRRLAKLNENKLVQSLGNGIYEITSKGTSYLSCEYDAENRKYIDEDEPKSAGKQTSLHDLEEFNDQDELKEKISENIDQVSSLEEVFIEVTGEGNTKKSVKIS